MGTREWPRITLVTPSFNQAQFLSETIESVLAQDYPNLEYLVFDGGSTDRSVEILRHYGSHLTYWESVPDNGQADAIAKGFRRGTGDWLNWLNSDDLLAPCALKHIASLVASHPDADMLAAAVENFDDGSFAGVRDKAMPQNIDLESLLLISGRRPVRHQPGIFFTRRIYEAVNGLNSHYHYCMDLDLHLRFLAHGARVDYSTETVAYFRRHPNAKTALRRNALATVKEYIEIATAVGARVGMAPRHHEHVPTLLGGARDALSRREFAMFFACLGNALRFGGFKAAIVLWRRWRKKGRNKVNGS
jgi:glycosyltransferase involved in cell wall biosynthesis